MKGKQELDRQYSIERAWTSKGYRIGNRSMENGGAVIGKDASVDLESDLHRTKQGMAGCRKEIDCAAVAGWK
jgi:hypothetical protein